MRLMHITEDCLLTLLHAVHL